jgi:hypothetical protein
MVEGKLYVRYLEAGAQVCVRISQRRLGNPWVVLQLHGLARALILLNKTVSRLASALHVATWFVTLCTRQTAPKLGGQGMIHAKQYSISKMKQCLPGESEVSINSLASLQARHNIKDPSHQILLQTSTAGNE